MVERHPVPSTCESPESCIEKGHCQVHGIEIERRKQTTKDVNELKLAMRDCQNVINSRIDKVKNKLDSDGAIWGGLKDASDFRSAAKVVGMIFAGVYFASFIYTFMHIQSSDKKFEVMDISTDKKIQLLSSELHVTENKLDKLISDNTDQLNNLEIEIRLTSDRYNRILSDMAELKTLLVKVLGEKTVAESLDKR